MKSPGKCLLWLLVMLAAPLFATADPAEVRIAVFGDSLGAGYNLPRQAAFPARLEKALGQAGYDVTVMNASVSGDTTAGGVARLDWTLADRPQLVIVELGGNDALRGIDPRQTRENLNLILTRLKEAGVEVLLAGMRAPRNLGSDYYTRFDRLFPELAARHGVTFYPFFLEGVAGQAALNQADGIHPNAAGIEVIVENILPTVIEALQPIVSNPRKQ